MHKCNKTNRKFTIFISNETACLRFYFYFLSRERMKELNPQSVEIESVGWPAVEVVATDGPAEAVGMGTVYTELMSAAGQRTEFHYMLAKRSVQRYGILSVSRVNLLERTVRQIRG